MRAELAQAFDPRLIRSARLPASPTTTGLPTFTVPSSTLDVGSPTAWPFRLYCCCLPGGAGPESDGRPGEPAARSDVGRVDRVEDFFEDYRLGGAGGNHLAQHILVNRARVEELGFDEVSLTPLERGRSEDDAGSSPDAATPVDDDSHGHRMPALIAYSMASVSESTPNFDSKSVTSV